ncbi:Uncharacterised protein [Streptococcus pneumoniae]|nr:Uncharacterised protein [Streptococcus pneumoniae]
MEQTLVIQKKKRFGFSQGIGITLLIAIAAKYLAELPFLNIMGQLVIAILIGMVWRADELHFILHKCFNVNVSVYDLPFY